MGDFIADLTHSIAGTVDTSARRRAEYAVDASNYRVPPRAVVFPTTTADVAAILDVARSHSVPITSRGGGTSQAGNAIGTGVVIDFSRHLNRVLDIDPVAKTARVEPGVSHERSAEGRCPARSALRTRSVDEEPGHDRGHDRQQLLRTTRDLRGTHR
ncbi:FAD-binding oxidoreductase [Brevibacterium sp. UCMA 11754]|uniref:FAD-binding oxidoreductase n=1 Tax=Brevibacterium sp. UCMA 11754 TaxID=2749198 RepID=UPI002E1A427F